MKIASTVVALGLLLTACSRHDSQPSLRITGTDKYEATGAGVEMAISPDGSWFTRNTAAGHTNTYSGTWQIEDGFLVMTLTNSPNPNHPASAEDIVRFKIVHLDKHQLIYKDSGRTVTLTR